MENTLGLCEHCRLKDDDVYIEISREGEVLETLRLCEDCAEKYMKGGDE